MKKKKPTKKICLNCGEIFYTQREKAKYCCSKCYWTSQDPKLKKRQRRNGEKTIGKQVKENGPWNKGTTKETDPRNARPGQEKHFGDKLGWAKGLTKETSASLRIISEKVSVTVSQLYADGKIHGYGNSKKGYYTSKITGKEEHFDSSYELKRMKQLDELGLQWTKKHGITIEYKNDGEIKHYVPDFLIDDRVIEEVKPEKLLKYFNNDLKLETLKNFCDKTKYEYRIITEKELRL